MKTILWSLLLVAPSLAGCAGPGSDLATPAGFADDAARLTGQVFAENHLPLPGATLTLLPTQIQTQAEEDGSFLFAFVQPGSHQLRAEAEGHGMLIQEVTLAPGEDKNVLLVMPPRPSNAPFRAISHERGFFQCSVGALAISTSCSPPGSPDKDVFPLAIAQGLFGIVNEMTWRPSSFATGTKLTFHMFPNATGSATSFCGDSGDSPLVMRWHRDVGCEVDSWAHAPHQSHVPEEGMIRTIVWHAPALGPPPPYDWLGVGITYGQSFELWTSLFYNGPAPAEYTALEDG